LVESTVHLNACSKEIRYLAGSVLMVVIKLSTKSMWNRTITGHKYGFRG